MKRKFLIGLLFGVILGVGIAIGVYFLTVGEVAWKQYLEEKLVPAATATVSALLLIYFGVAPVLKNIITATSLFNQATDNVNSTAQSGREANESLEDFKTGITQMVTEAVKSQDEKINSIEQHSANTEAIVRIAFGNTEELVKKGYAREIAKVGAKNEEDEA